jgi:hypothetical protein
MHLFAGSYGDADSPIAARIIGSIPNQDSGSPHETHKLCVLRANVDEDEVGATGPVAKFCLVECGFEFRTRLKNYAYHSMYAASPSAGGRHARASELTL